MLDDLRAAEPGAIVLLHAWWVALVLVLLLVSKQAVVPVLGCRC